MRKLIAFLPMYLLRFVAEFTYRVGQRWPDGLKAGSAKDRIGDFVHFVHKYSSRWAEDLRGWAYCIPLSVRTAPGDARPGHSQYRG